MSDTRFTFQGSGTIASPKSTTTSTKTVFEITAPANQAVRIESFKISFDGTSSSGPQPLVEVLTDCTTGQGSGTSLTLYKNDPEQALTLQSSAKEDFSSEGSPGGQPAPGKSYVHPQGRDWVLPMPMRLRHGKALRVRVTVGTAVNYTFTGTGTE